MTRLPSYWWARRFGGAPPLPLAMSFVVTDRCNSLCETCNIGRRYLADPKIADGELSADEYTRLFATVGHPTWVTLSGGEPFMRKDFADIVLSLLSSAAPRFVNVPTNGTFVHATARAIERIAPALGSTRLLVNFSVDGAGIEHDRVRGFEGNAERLVAAVRAVRDAGRGRVLVGVNTTLSRFNAAQADDILDWVETHVAPDSHVVEVAQIRPEYYNEGTALVEDDGAVQQALARVRARTVRDRRRGVARVIRAFRLAYYDASLSHRDADRAHRCYAGFSTCTVMPKGVVWTNTSRAEPMGDLRDHGLDFAALWRSAEARAARDRVRAGPCRCEASNASYTNALMSPRTMAAVALNWVRFP